MLKVKGDDGTVVSPDFTLFIQYSAFLLTPKLNQFPTFCSVQSLDWTHLSRFFEYLSIQNHTFKTSSVLLFW